MCHQPVQFRPAVIEGRYWLLMWPKSANRLYVPWWLIAWRAVWIPVVLALAIPLTLAIAAQMGPSDARRFWSDNFWKI